MEPTEENRLELVEHGLFSLLEYIINCADNITELCGEENCPYKKGIIPCCPFGEKGGIGNFRMEYRKRYGH